MRQIAHREKGKEVKRCTRCVLPETVPGIVFDEEGVCSFCADYKGETYLDQGRFQDLVTQAKSRGAKYDCIVPLSGGRDSSFVLYDAKVKHNLNVLAVNYDHEFRNPEAVKNMERACRAVHVDFMPVRSRRDIAGKILRCRIRSVESQGMYGLCNSMCIACSYGYRSVVYQLTERYDVPLILWGASQVEESEHITHKILKAFFRAHVDHSRTVKMRFYKRMAALALFLQRIEFHVQGNSLFRKERPTLRNPNITEVKYFDYIPWDPHEIEEVITTKLGWRKPEGHVSSWRTDCLLHPIVNFAFFKILGCSRDCFGYTNMINAGKMSRAEALAQEEEMQRTFSDDRKVRAVLEKEVGLSPKEVGNVFAAHERSMEDA